MAELDAYCGPVHCPELRADFQQERTTSCILPRFTLASEPNVMTTSRLSAARVEAIIPSSRQMIGNQLVKVLVVGYRTWPTGLEMQKPLVFRSFFSPDQTGIRPSGF